MALLRELVVTPGPPGQEAAVRAVLEAWLESLGIKHQTDAKGNLLVSLGTSERPKIVVTAHMDEIAMMVRSIGPGGRISLAPLGGLHPWKVGEGPVQLLVPGERLEGVLSMGGIHTESPESVARKADHGPIEWSHAHVFTGLSAEELAARDVRPGTRVVLHPSRRGLMEFRDWIGSFFLDDRADLVAWLLALEELRAEGSDVLFAATTGEEVGGEGALFLLQNIRPEVCIALELGPNVDDAPVKLSSDPTVWVGDSYAAMLAEDGDLIAEVGRELGMSLQFQALSRGGSDASCAASHGLCARPITLGLPMENSHGYEVIHRNAMTELARLTVALVRRLSS